jgi:hypothetical protein
MAAKSRISARMARARMARPQNGERPPVGKAEVHPLDRVIERMEMAQHVLQEMGRYQRMAEAGASDAAQDALLDKIGRQVARLEAEMRRP